MLKAMTAGLGLFLSFGVSLGALMFFMADAGGLGGAFFGAIVLLLAVLLSPILATIVGAIIARNYDDDITAIWNGALVGAIGTVIMVLISVLVMVVALADEDGDDEDGDDEDGDDEDGDDSTTDEAIGMLLKALIPSAIGGALGAFFGRFVWV